MTDEQYKGTKLDYPKTLCGNCHHDKFWYRGGGEWVCMTCRAPTPGSKEELIARAMLANQRMYHAWFSLIQYTKSEPEWPETLAQYQEGVKKCIELARQLKERSLTDCLYIENGKKLKKCNIFPKLYEPAATIDNFICHCCPNDYWWEKELLDIDTKRNPEVFKR